MFLILLPFIALSSMSNVKAIRTQMSGVFFGRGGGGCMRKSQNFSVKKKLHTALRSVQFLASFIGFYFEILSYLACGEKIICLASKNSVKLGENQLVISSLSDMLVETLFLLKRYIYTYAHLHIYLHTCMQKTTIITTNH